MKTIETHKVNPCNDVINIEVLDGPGAGGASHHYFVSGFHTRNNPAADSSCRDDTGVHILFQNGPIGEAGVNGVTQEVLLAIVRDRLVSFQAGPYACDENAQALMYVEKAIEILHSRTRGRVARGVEGTHEL
jgi:hypothetical protein